MKAENQEKVLLTARKMIAEYGDSVSVREIALKSGITHPALRKRWKSRAELFGAVRDSINADLADALGPAPENESLPVFLIKALFALKKVEDAAGYYSYRFMPSFPAETTDQNPILERLLANSIQFVSDNPDLKSKYGPLFSDPKVLSVSLFSMLIAFSPARLSRICESVEMPDGTQEQLPIMFLNSLTAFFNTQ